ncbi:hypothetical protein HNP84_008821 [Thermocatellispora tengchongensis]|uniref:Oxidoreductase n=1 Tax=Thermocatellispora tengchongensis TaxID=1073253 RepID=A0A840PHM8_9ACTN|nr:PmoA family protein [Thermocatellispora tengchongensis]MBB5139058.1 hypothetical protein [Thermocatellispora tengchongensis]
MKDTGAELVHEIGGVEVLRYVYRPDMPQRESPKPYFHPLRTLSGDLVTGYRPHDHRWHKGLQMTVSHLSGQNFWGGGSYVHGQGYVDLPNNGSMRHEEWLAPGVERLTWWTQDGEHWVDETRTIEVAEGEGWWRLGFATTLRNVRGEDLLFGSPTSHGRPAAGYSGLFWRGPRDFTGGTVLASDGQGGPEMMGRTASWLAYVGQHDEVDRHSTLLFLAGPGQTWFVRTEPFPAVNPSIAFSEDVRLPPGGVMDLRYALVVADGALDRGRLESLAADLAPTP